MTLTFDGWVGQDRNFREERLLKEAGDVDGKDWREHCEYIADLEREGRLDEARTLLAKCVTAAEGQAQIWGTQPDKWPTEHLSSMLRKMKDLAADLAVLERYVAACGEKDAPEKMVKRLESVRKKPPRRSEHPTVWLAWVLLGAAGRDSPQPPHMFLQWPHLGRPPVPLRRFWEVICCPEGQSV